MYGTEGRWYNMPFGMGMQISLTGYDSKAIVMCWWAIFCRRSEKWDSSFWWRWIWRFLLSWIWRRVVQ